jgi:hypothetical protein
MQFFCRKIFINLFKIKTISFSSTSITKGLSAFATTGGGLVSESEVEDEESSPVIEAISPTAADGGKMATAPLTTITTTTAATTAATVPVTTSTDGEKEGRKMMV